MPDVPEHLVVRRVEQAVHGDGDLAGAEVRAEVPADLPDRVDDQVADLLAGLAQLIVREGVKVLGFVDPLEDAHRTVPGNGRCLSIRSRMPITRYPAACGRSMQRPCRSWRESSSLASEDVVRDLLEGSRLTCSLGESH